MLVPDCLRPRCWVGISWAGYMGIVLIDGLRACGSYHAPPFRTPLVSQTSSPLLLPYPPSFILLYPRYLWRLPPMGSTIAGGILPACRKEPLRKVATGQPALRMFLGKAFYTPCPSRLPTFAVCVRVECSSLWL